MLCLILLGVHTLSWCVYFASVLIVSTVSQGCAPTSLAPFSLLSSTTSAQDKRTRHTQTREPTGSMGSRAARPSPPPLGKAIGLLPPATGEPVSPRHSPLDANHNNTVSVVGVWFVCVCVYIHSQVVLIRTDSRYFTLEHTMCSPVLQRSKMNQTRVVEKTLQNAITPVGFAIQ